MKEISRSARIQGSSAIANRYSRGDWSSLLLKICRPVLSSLVNVVAVFIANQMSQKSNALLSFLTVE